MTNKEFYKIIGLEEGAVSQLNQYESNRVSVPDDIYKRLLARQTWDEAVKELQTLLGEDSCGMKILWEEINLITSFSYPEYKNAGFSDEVFAATFGFISRFINQNRSAEGKYRFEKAWWLPRQIALQEFRIGELEYEFAETSGRKEIAVHIPSDADMNIEALCRSFKDFFSFRRKHFAEWKDAPVTTETWLLMPELEDFLPAGSKILAFKHLFEIEKVDYEQTWYMEWVFPGFTSIDENLPEKTTLHRNLKKHLLCGKKFGVAKGHLVAERLPYF